MEYVRNGLKVRSQLKRKTPLKVGKSLKKSKNTPLNVKNCLKNTQKPLKRSYIKKKPVKNPERHSLLTNDMGKCYICGKSSGIEIHEVFFGTAFRKRSIEFDCTVPLCQEHHRGNSGVHLNRELDLKVKRDMQEVFEKKYSHDKYMEVFKRNYL